MFTDIQLTGFVLLPMALLGTICNWTAVYILQKLATFRHSFGYLSSSQAIADAIHSTLSLIYFCPMVISNHPLLVDYSHHCGFLLVSCYELSVHTHLAVSLNRFFAVWTPLEYQIWFKDRNTKLVIAILWLVTWGYSTVFYEVLCHLYYDPATGFFVFTNSVLCQDLGRYCEFYKNFPIVFIIVIIDILTVLKVRSINREIQSTYRVSTREINFLKQTVCQGSTFALELLTYFLLPGYLSNPWAVFFATSFAWVTVNAMNGVILMTFNKEFKKFIFGKNQREHVVPGSEIEMQRPGVSSTVC